jgi:hypothetical protein
MVASADRRVSRNSKANERNEVRPFLLLSSVRRRTHPCELAGRSSYLAQPDGRMPGRDILPGLYKKVIY